MSKLEEFKEFVKSNPRLLKHVNEGTKSWQSFYEMYDIYGPTNEAWNDFINLTPLITPTQQLNVGDLFGIFKNIKIENVQSGIENLQKLLGVVQGLSTSEDTKTEEYKPRPMYKHFED